MLINYTICAHESNEKIKIWYVNAIIKNEINSKNKNIMELKKDLVNKINLVWEEKKG